MIQEITLTISGLLIVLLTALSSFLWFKLDEKQQKASFYKDQFNVVNRNHKGIVKAMEESYYERIRNGERTIRDLKKQVESLKQENKHLKNILH